MEERGQDAIPWGPATARNLARELALGPTVLLLDEPAAGLNDVKSLELADLIRDRFGCPIIVIDDDLHFIMRLCERITVMDIGPVIAEGPVYTVRRDPKVIEIYPGSTR